MILKVTMTLYGPWRLRVACGARTSLKIPREGHHTAPYCSKAAQELLLMTWHVQHNSL